MNVPTRGSCYKSCTSEAISMLSLQVYLGDEAHLEISTKLR